jgi:predicted SAM-dependent methyltransferase
MSPYATSSYDTVWTIALTLRHAIDQTQKSNGQENSLLLENFTYENGTETRNIFFDIMQDLGFLGISVSN